MGGGGYTECWVRYIFPLCCTADIGVCTFDGRCGGTHLGQAPQDTFLVFCGCFVARVWVHVELGRFFQLKIKRSR